MSDESWLHEPPKALCWRMDWQQGIALLIVLVTASLFVRGWWKRRSDQSVCGSQCGCAGSGTATPPKVSVVYRARKGERPQIITRMS